jgi:hypothetical protein
VASWSSDVARAAPNSARVATRGQFDYAGVLFEDYRGWVRTVDFHRRKQGVLLPGRAGTVPAVHRARRLRRDRHAIGLPRYAKQALDQRLADQLTVGGESFLVQGEPERRDPDRLVWTLDVRPT